MRSWRSGTYRPTVLRRFGIAGIALVVSTLVLRVPLSSALISRGDDMLYQGDTARALSFYRRALTFNSQDEVAADRFAFVSMTLHRPTNLREAIAVATRFLNVAPSDSVLRMDRALCEWRLRNDRAAESDFGMVGVQRNDPRALVFAGYAALRDGKGADARRWWRAALGIRARYVPALRALVAQ